MSTSRRSLGERHGVPGHSDLRVRVLGLSRSVGGAVKPNDTEMENGALARRRALDRGFLGLSTTNPWDKLDGDRHRSAPLPSTFATWGSTAVSTKCRRHGRIRNQRRTSRRRSARPLHVRERQLVARKALKTTLITLADARSTPVSDRRDVHALRELGVRRRSPLKNAARQFGPTRRNRSRRVRRFAADALTTSSERWTGELMKDQAYRRRSREGYDAAGPCGARFPTPHRGVGRNARRDRSATSRRTRTSGRCVSRSVVSSARRSDGADREPSQGRDSPHDQRAGPLSGSPTRAHIRNMAFYSFPPAC